MKILHLAAGNRWTGAAAPAFAEVEALRGAGIDAHYAYVGGYKLQAKLAHHDFAHPLIAKAQNPISFLRTAAALDNLIHGHHFDVIHAHLTYDHWLARFVGRSHRIRIARTFHSRRTLRNEPFTRSLLSRTEPVFVINDALADAPVLRGRNVIYTPPPLDADQFTAQGPDARAQYQLAPGTPVVTIIGKLSKGRGFEDALATFAQVRGAMPEVKLLLIGHGEHRPALEKLTATLGIAGSVIWAGYHEDDLAEHYRAANVLLFTAAGSDEGHRAVTEAMGCGVAPATYPIDGMRALLGELAPRHMARSEKPEELAPLVIDLLHRRRDELAAEVNQRAQLFHYPRAASRLIDGYSTVI